MPIRFRIDEEIGIVITTAEGRVTGEDLLEHARALMAVPDRPVVELVDFSDQSEITVPVDSVRRMARFLREQDVNLPGSKLALVGKTDAIFGMLRLFGAHRDHAAVAIRAFRERDEALGWLRTEP